MIEYEFDSISNDGLPNNYFMFEVYNELDGRKTVWNGVLAGVKLNATPATHYSRIEKRNKLTMCTYKEQVDLSQPIVVEKHIFEDREKEHMRNRVVLATLTSHLLPSVASVDDLEMLSPPKVANLDGIAVVLATKMLEVSTPTKNMDVKIESAKAGVCGNQAGGKPMNFSRVCDMSGTSRQQFGLQDVLV
nr:hypothetical protein [Tanacetum cinerariifolium]